MPYVVKLHCQRIVMEVKRMNLPYIALKILMWALIVLFAGDLVIQTISFSFYKGDRQMKNVAFPPEKIQIADGLTGYGHGLTADSDRFILCFGGSNYIAYNTVGMYSGYYNCPFISVDYYGTQDSRGKMNLRTMKRSAEQLYDWATEHYPDSEIVVMGHSYGCGMAAYLASVRKCSRLILVSGYRSSADLYNKILPLYHGPLQVFIKNNIRVDQYAGSTDCPVLIIGSDSDNTLSAEIQEKLADCYNDAQLKIFQGISHEDYLTTPEVTGFIEQVISGDNAG